MRICLLSLVYPPISTEGIARQRQALAAELSAMGHEIYVVTCGPRAHSRDEAGARVHAVAAPRTRRYLPDRAALDGLLSDSQALYEGLLSAGGRRGFDIIDAPLWAAQGFVAQQRHPGPVVLWLQTTSAQLMAINGRRPSPVDRWRLSLERACVQRAHGILADSRAALAATARDYPLPAAAPAGVAHLGLPPLAEPPAPRAGRPGVTALAVGRLERRKGTPLLFELLPGLLRAHPGLGVRFVGRDNSAEDGWLAQHGQSYPEFFRARHPELAARVHFAGPVDDEQLAAHYRDADLLLAPSLYESFGLVYLEAMRAGLPVVALAGGGASEIFARGEADGALLSAPGDAAALAANIGRLARDEPLRRRLGDAGLARFGGAFTARAMAEATLSFYERVIADHQARHGGARPVYQVMEALDAGDAVSGIARGNAALLGAIGEPPVVLSRTAGPGCAPLEQALATPACRLIFHYWGFSTATWLPQALAGPMALHFHNITPPGFAPPGSPLHAHLARGYAQLAQIVGRFDLLIGDSRYNLDALAPLLDGPRPALHLYPVVERDQLLAAPHDRRLAARLRASGETHILFVGRIARNKGQDRLMRAFDQYARAHNPRAQLWLVGSDRFDPAYSAELEALRRALPAGDRVALTGKLSEARLLAHLRAADLLLCASEHEGFCVPIAQAMALGVPVLALAAAAVPETLGAPGGLIDAWDDAAVAARAHAVLGDAGLRARLLQEQGAAAARFSAAAARARLAAVVAFLREGAPSPLIEPLSPAAPQDAPA